ncbi:MAG: nucleotidyltransferase substrate binding protein [Desulfovermiculus sp.]
MSGTDIRWMQRFENFCKALGQLSKFIEKRELSELEEQGLIQAFEYTYELAWNTIKDFYEHQGETGIQGSRDALRLAFRRQLIENGDAWMRMIQSRALTSHTYNEDTARKIATEIFSEYYPQFVKLKETLSALKTKEMQQS